MVTDLLQMSFIVSLLAGMIRVATPLLFGALGELVTERAGILNVGVEGMMLAGAFCGFVVTFKTGSLWAGVAGAALGGAVLSLVMAFMTATLKIDQTVSGLTLNIFSSGITFYLYRVVFSDVAGKNLPTVPVFPPINIPFLSEIPFLGPVLFSHYGLTYIALLLVPLVSLFLYRTKYGLALRCLGENPRAVDMKGLNLLRYQYLAVIFGGMMSGLGGGFLTMASTGLFVPDITAGRGWIAIAIVIFGNWKPLNILLAALFFGMLDTLQLQMQGIGFDVPYQLLLALPYLLTVVVLVSSRHRSGSPLSLGVPYNREG